MKTTATKTHMPKIIAAVAVVFGALTILSGGTVLFGGDAARSAAGATVPFVLWFNFLSGFAYVVAGIGLAFGQGWAVKLAIGLALAIAVIFAAFGLYVLQGGAYEMRTVGALTLRLSVWVIIAAWARKAIA
jgi:hypothetical protein